MAIKQLIKKGLEIIFSRRPIKMTAQIVELAPSDLLKGRTALITGGTSGIGYAIANAMLNAGASVIIVGRSKQRLNDSVDSLIQISADRKGHVFGQQMDVSDYGSIESGFRNVLDIVNANKLQNVSILVNSAGVLGGEFGKAEESEYDAVLNTNLKGMFFLSQTVAHNMKKNKTEGNIINIGSSSSLRPASSAYTISKWGVRGLTLGMAKSLIPFGIVVNAIAPGPTATPMLIDNPKQGIAHSKNPLGRFATPEEIANMSVFLASAMGRTIVGDMIFMTGGAGNITFDDLPYSFE